MRASGPCGVLVIDKPRGPTSHDIVAHVRRALQTREVGHAGTLDPMATGVLVVAVGEATKLVPWLTAHDKSYEATISLGIQTDTLDADGRELEHRLPSSALLEALSGSHLPLVSPLLREALARERVRTTQVPPAFSAIRTGGQRAFEQARRGVAPELAPRPISVARLEAVACSPAPARLDVELDVGKGYYVRSLARDLAEALGTVGHLTRLRRTRSGPFLIAEAVSIDASPEALRTRLVPLPEAAARTLPVARLTDAGARDARCGRVVQPADIHPMAPGPFAWLDPQGDLVAIGQAVEGHGRVVRGFVEPLPIP